MVKNITAICKFNNEQNNTFEPVTFNNTLVSIHALPDVINNVLINSTNGIPTIDTFKLSDIRRACGPPPDKCIVDEHDLLLALNRHKLKTAIGPDCILNKLLKRLSLLVAPICAIIDSSFHQGIIPYQ